MNNQLMNASNTKTMTSREIAELTGKDHGSVVVRDIENMIKALGWHPAKLQDGDSKGISCVRKIYNGRDVVDFYELDKEMTMTLVAGYNVKLRRAVVRRWLELENSTPQFEIPKTLGEALLLAGKLATEVEQRAAQLEAQAPAVEFADRVSNANGAVTRRNAAKILDYPALAFNEWLKANRFSNGDGMPSSSELKRGHQRVTVGEKNGHAYSTPRITTKGLRYYASKLYVTEVPDNVLDNIENQSN